MCSVCIQLVHSKAARLYLVCHLVAAAVRYRSRPQHSIYDCERVQLLLPCCLHLCQFDEFSLSLSLSPLSVAHFHFFPLIQSSPAVAVDIVLWFLLFSRLFFLKVILFQYSKHCVYGSVFPATTFHSVMPIILSDEFRSVEWKKRHRTFLPSAGVALTIRFNLYDCFCIVDISIFLYFFRTFFSPFIVSSWNIDCIRRFSMWLAVLFVFFGCGANQTI